MSVSTNCKVISISNQKGGTAKTTTACNLGYALAKQGYRVLLVDMDPQANLSMSCGIESPDELELSMSDILTIVMKGEELPLRQSYIHPTSISKVELGTGEKEYVLDIMPSNISLTITEINLRDEMGGEHTLKSLLDPMRADYDYIIIDTNPYLGLLTINALAACDEVLIPVSAQYWSATGLTDLLQTIFKVKRKLNRGIEVGGILLTICDERTKLYREARSLLDTSYGDKIKIFNTIIPATVKVGEANYMSKSVVEYEPNSKAAIAYVALAKELTENSSAGEGDADGETEA